MSSPQFKVFKYTLQPQEVQTIHRPANTVICLLASQAFEIAFDYQPLTAFQQGLSYEAIGTIKKVQIKNSSATVLTVELGLASGGIRDARLSIDGGIDANIIGGNTMADSNVSALATAETVVLASSSTRSEALITNEGTKTVYLGGVGITANKGLPLTAGSTATLTTKAAISVYNPDAAAQSLAVLEMST